MVKKSPSFSERLGIVNEKFQKNNIDKDLENALWNALYKTYFRTENDEDFEITSEEFLAADGKLWEFWSNLNEYFYKSTIDDLEQYWPSIKQIIKENFRRSLWNQKYEFIEFVAENYPSNKGLQKKFQNIVMKH